MSSDSHDRINRVLGSVPLDKKAARVMGKGVHYDPDVEYAGHEHSDTPPPVFALKEIIGSGREVARELMGLRVGRFAVIGLAREQGATNGKQGRKQRARWVVRCDCGAYEYRKAKVFRDPTNRHLMCRKCSDLEHKKWAYANRGAKPLSNFINKGVKDK